MEKLLAEDVVAALDVLGESPMLAHYRIWGSPGTKLGMHNLEDSIRRISKESLRLCRT